MKQFTMEVATKMGQLLAYMDKWGKSGVRAGEAASVMGVSRNQVASLCSTMIRHQYLVPQKRPFGLYYKLQNGVAITRPSDGYLTISRPADSDCLLQPNLQREAAPVVDQVKEESDEADGYLRGRHTWVQAAGLPAPYTTAARSVFDLAGRLDHV